MTTFAIFFSSPGDVGEERLIAHRVIDRLRGELAGSVAIEPVFWEHEPLRATASFQEQITRPADCDVAVFILWSRLGTRLPAQLTRPDGTRYSSGTEYEFEDALESYRRRKVPDVLVYRKTAETLTLLDRAVVTERLAQKEALDAFLDRWFRAPDGSFIAAFHQFQRPAEFEDLLERHLRKLIQDRLPGLARGAPPPVPVWTSGSPFRGLEPFEANHARVFFGRTQAVSDVLNALRRQAAVNRGFVLIAGMSGLGKSSLVRAGVLPALTRPGVIEGIGLWRTVVHRPSDVPNDLLLGLATAFWRADCLPAGETSVAEFAQGLRESPVMAMALLRTRLHQTAMDVQRTEGLDAPPDARLAIAIDQLEEIFTLPNVTGPEREAFVAALSALARSGFAWVMATIRSDVYARCAELPELLALKEGSGQVDLRSPTPAEVSQMIRDPARLAGLRYEEDPDSGERLDDVLRDAAAREPQALPLLQFTLEQLYATRTPEGVLTFQAYRFMGGMEGAIGHRAEEAFTALPRAAQEAFAPVASALVTVGLEDESVSRRRVPTAALASVPGADALVRGLVGARLLTADRNEAGEPVVQVGHEALLQHWARMRQWVADNWQRLRAGTRLRTAAALWRAEGESPAFLAPEGRSLNEALELVRVGGAEFTEAEIQYVQASAAAARNLRRQSRRRAYVVAAACAALVLSAGAYWYGFVHESATYYANFVKVHGVPRGLGPLSDDRVRGRRYSLRIVQKGRWGRVDRMEVVNGAGRLTADHDIGLFLGQPAAGDPTRECLYKFIWDGDTVREERALDCRGRQRFRFVYEPKSDTSPQYLAKFSSRLGAPDPRVPSGASYVKFTRSPEGFETRYEFLDAAQNPRPDGDGVYAHELKFDGDGRPIEVSYLDAGGRRLVNQHGIAGIALKWGPFGITTQDFFDVSQRRTAHKEGHYGVRQRYDDRGNVVQWVAVGSNGQPVATASGPAIVDWEYDDAGNRVVMRYSDAAGQPAANGDGIAEVRSEYDSQRRETKRMFLGTSGKPVVTAAGFAGVRRKWDDDNNVSEETYLGADDEPLTLPTGYATVRNTYDRNGTLVEQLYFLADGQSAVSGPSGLARTTFRYAEGDEGTLVEMTAHRRGGRVTHTLSARGQVTQERFFGADGAPLAGALGNFGRQLDYDERGRIVREVLLGSDGKPRETPLGYLSVEYDYDDNGAVVAWRHKDAAGRVVDTQAVVETVAQGSEAARIGLQRHDVLLTLGGEAIKKVGDLQRLTGSPGRGPRKLRFSRSGRVHEVDARPGRLGITVLDIARGAYGRADGR